MADGDLLVTISGAALSLLFFENVRSVGDQMGFLLGEVLEFVVKTYTDSDNQVETIKTHINVETIVTCPLSALLTETNWISKEKLKDFMRDKSKQVVGWFRFRRNISSLNPTLKDKILHKEFASHFADLSENSCRKDFFLICLLNASTSETRGTHKFRHVFLRLKRGFEPIPLRINNLGDDASRHDGSDYKPTPIRKYTSVHASDEFSKSIESLKLDMRQNGLESAMLIQKLAEQHLTSLIPKVRESDLEVAELERQVRELKGKVEAQRLAKNLKVNGENCEKANRKNCLLEKIDSSMRNDMKISDNVHLQKEHCVQPGSFNRTLSRNTAAYIAKSVNQDKSRHIGVGNQEDDNQQQSTQEFLVNSRRNVPEITSEPICQEDNEICMGRGRGRGRGRGSYEFTPGMKKARRNPGMVHSSRERSTTSPEQDFSDIECSAAAPHSPVPRSYSQTAKKTSVDKCNAMTSLDI